MKVFLLGNVVLWGAFALLALCMALILPAGT